MNSQKNPPKIPTKIPKKSQDFENIQSLTSHLEAENPLGLVHVTNEKNPPYLRAVFHLINEKFGLYIQAYPFITED